MQAGYRTEIETRMKRLYARLGVQHRLENVGRVPLEMIEVQCGSYLRKDDIVRFEDNYGRHVEK